MPELRCSAILFDLDGVLVDSTAAIIEVWTAWALKNGIEPAHMLETIHGRRSVEAMQLLTPHLDFETEAQQIEAAVTHREGGTVAIPGAARLLKSLPEERWCIVTSGIGEFARSRLREAGLPIPRVLVAAGDVSNGKPHPEPYLKGAKLLGIDPATCIVIEDALNGIRAAQAAGMKAIGLATTYTLDELKEADVVVKTLEGVDASYSNGELVIKY